MHSFAHHHHSQPGNAVETQGRVLNQGWFYDLGLWFMDTLVLRGKFREMRRRVIDLAQIEPGNRVLDVGCGTGTLAIEIAQCVGPTGLVLGIDPGTEQIARARSKTVRRNLPVDFQLGVIEHLNEPEQSFDAVVSSIMRHHLPDDLKRQGLAEIARVLRPRGRLVIADFNRSEANGNGRAHLGVGTHGAQDLLTLIQEAGFVEVRTEEMRLPRFAGLPDVGFVSAQKT